MLTLIEILNIKKLKKKEENYYFKILYHIKLSTKLKKPITIKFWKFLFFRYATLHLQSNNLNTKVLTNFPLVIKLNIFSKYVEKCQSNGNNYTG